MNNIPHLSNFNVAQGFCYHIPSEQQFPVIDCGCNVDPDSLSYMFFIFERILPSQICPLAQDPFYIRCCTYPYFSVNFLPSGITRMIQDPEINNEQPLILKKEYIIDIERKALTEREYQRYTNLTKAEKREHQVEFCIKNVVIIDERKGTRKKTRMIINMKEEELEELKRETKMPIKSKKKMEILERLLLRKESSV